MQLTVDNTAGWEDTVLWNPYGNEGMGYNNFVCVESVKVRQRDAIIVDVMLMLLVSLNPPNSIISSASV